MPPKSQNSAEDSKVGIITCTGTEYSQTSPLAFVVQAKLALVLDRQSLDDGQIIGMVCQGDVVCASMVELPWVMLASGSSVRHPKMREGRIKIQRDGWLITSHPEYGGLLMPFGADKVRRYLDEDLFAKLPIVKAKAKAKAKASSSQEPLLQSRRDVEEAKRLAELARIEEEQRREMDLRLEEARRAKEEAAQAKAEAEETVRRQRKAAERRREAKEAEEEAEEAEAAPASVEFARPSREDVAKAKVARAKAVGPRAAGAEAAKAGFPPGPPEAAGKSVAAQFLPFARGVDVAIANAKASLKKSGLAKPAPAAKAGKGGLQALEAVERAKAPPETLESHLRTCGGEHWKVVHDFVFMRSKASTAADQLCVLRRGAVFCLGSEAGTPVPEMRSQDGKWVKCCSESKVWPKIETQEPEFLLKNHVFAAGFVLIRNEEHGDLLRLVPNTKPDGAVASSKDPLKPPETPLKDAIRPPPEPELRAEPITQEAAAKMHHWVVEGESKVFASRDESSAVEVALKEGDLIMVGGANWTRTWADISGKKWLLLPPGGQVYRKLQPLLPYGGNKRSSYIIVQDAETELVREYTPPETGVTVRLVSGYGEPWVVEHDQVVVRRGPSTTDVPVGIMLKGDVVGVMQKKGDWVQLMQDSDVRFRKKGTAGMEASTTFLSTVNSVRETKVEEAVLKQRRDLCNEPLAVPTDPRGEPALEAWMLVEHPTLGILLRRARKRKGGFNNGVVICKARMSLYREVAELCHRRIYEENLDGLWDGERDKLPTLECIEAKLFDSHTSVLHVTTAGKFCGGAIIKEVAVRARQVEGSSNLNLTGHASPASEVEERPGRTMVGYIDSCAAVPRTGGGRTIWDSISSLPFVCLTCHSILLQKTVDFWQACGMRRLDPSNPQDCEEFKKNILVHTMGKVILELSDIQKELPSSKLPLFVWVPSRFSQVFVDPNSEYLFTPDDGEGYI